MPTQKSSLQVVFVLIALVGGDMSPTQQQLSNPGTASVTADMEWIKRSGSVREIEHFGVAARKPPEQIPRESTREMRSAVLTYRIRHASEPELIGKQFLARLPDGHEPEVDSKTVMERTPRAVARETAMQRPPPSLDTKLARTGDADRWPSGHGPEVSSRTVAVPDILEQYSRVKKHAPLSVPVHSGGHTTEEPTLTDPGHSDDKGEPSVHSGHAGEPRVSVIMSTRPQANVIVPAHIPTSRAMSVHDNSDGGGAPSNRISSLQMDSTTELASFVNSDTNFNEGDVSRGVQTADDVIVRTAASVTQPTADDFIIRTAASVTQPTASDNRIAGDVERMTVSTIAADAERIADEDNRITANVSRVADKDGIAAKKDGVTADGDSKVAKDDRTRSDNDREAATDNMEGFNDDRSSAKNDGLAAGDDRGASDDNRTSADNDRSAADDDTTALDDDRTTAENDISDSQEENAPETSTEELDETLRDSSAEVVRAKKKISKGKKVQYRLGTSTSSEEVQEEETEDLAKEMAEIRQLRTTIRRLEAEMKERLKGLRARAGQGKANRTQIVKFINEIEEETALEEVKGVHVMEIPAFQILQGQVLRVLQDREKFFRDIVLTVEQNVALMKEWVEVAKQLLVYKEKQVIVLFGEFSPVSNILHSGIATYLTLTEQFFSALGSLTEVKREFIDSFVSGRGGADFLLRAQNFTVDELIPAKINFVLNAFNNSEAIARVVGEIVKNANELLETKYNVVKSVRDYGDNRMDILRNALGTNLSFVELLDSVQKGTLLQRINVGPLYLRGDFLSREDTTSIIKNLVGIGDPKLPIIGKSIKEIIAGTDNFPPGWETYDRNKYVDSFLTQKFANAARSSNYMIRVKDGEAVAECNSPPIHLGNKCGLGFHLYNTKGRATIGRSSQVSLTAGPAFGYGRPPSLDIVTSAWLDSIISVSSQVSVTASKGLLGQCLSKVYQDFSSYGSARARSYISLKFSITNIRLETRLAQPRGMAARVEIPHILINFSLHLAGEINSLDLSNTKVSNCHLKLMGLPVLSYCGLVEKILRDEAIKNAKKSLPFSSTRILRQLERALMSRIGNEIAIPLFVFGERPVEKFLNTAHKIIQLGDSLVRNVTTFRGQMNTIMKSEAIATLG